MAHCMKMTRGALGHMLKHYERAKENGEYIKFGNQDIDTTKTEMNYNLAPDRGMQGEFIKQRCSEVKCLNRKDVNVLCSWVVTAPKDLKSSTEDFFKETYRFLEKRYGQENVVSAYVHMDETTPHMHFAFVPVVKDRKKGYEKVSAFECINKTELSKFHGDLQMHLEAHSIECTILNDATIDGNRTINELKRESIAKELQNAQERLESISKDIEVLSERKNVLMGQIEGIQGTLKTFGEIDEIGKQGMFGKITLTPDELKQLKDQAKGYLKVSSELESVKNDREKFRNRSIDTNKKYNELDSKYHKLEIKLNRAEEVLSSNKELGDLYLECKEKLAIQKQSEKQHVRSHNYER